MLAAERRAGDLLGRMTLDEKIGQMTQGDSGSLASRALLKRAFEV